MWTFIVFFVLLTGGHRAQDILHHVCPDKHIVSRINSPTDKDRQWKIECKGFGATSGCSWSSPQNWDDKELSKKCPDNHVVAGVSSNYSSAHGDRSWELLCCSAPKFVTFECQETPVVSYFNEDFSLQLPAGHFLTGVQTHQKNINGDHHWSFNYCKGTTDDTQTANSQILTVNQPEEDQFIKGNVLVRNKRNAKICENCRWQKTPDMFVNIPYVINDAFNTNEKKIIQSAMIKFNQTTCIRFVPHKKESDFISIVKTQKTCESYVGKAGGTQDLSLAQGCIHQGNIQHELLHALGFWHEQNRCDRDKYVKIIFKNILDEQKKNFKEYDTNNLGVPYDYDSVMHYGEETFSKNGLDTIEPLDSSAQIGQRKGMSHIDILKINLLYNCTSYLHTKEWNNKLNNAFSHMCPSGEAVSGIKSHYNSDKNDRFWAFSCKGFMARTACKWSSYVNDFEVDFNYKCDDNKVIAGAYSWYSTLHQDRKWKFYCCGHLGSSMSNYLTENKNVEESFTSTAPSNYFLTGVESHFEHNVHDRRWSFTYCQLDQQ